MSTYPEISEHVFSLLSVQTQDQLNDIKIRKVSAISARSASSTVSDFIDRKLHEFELDIDYTTQYRRGLKSAYDAETLPQKDWDRMREEINVQESANKKEYLTIRRQRKILEDDMTELGFQETLESAYTKIMINRVKLLRRIIGNGKKLQWLVQDNFRHRMIKYYQAGKNDPLYAACHYRSDMAYCMATGLWFWSFHVRATHIVPKSLESEELSYLFGAGEVGLSEPRNGLLLYRQVKLALDRAEIAFVPIPSQTPVEQRWKIILLDETKRNEDHITWFSAELSWKDLDGRELSFPTANRPAHSFLYFRYLMTYMTLQQKLGSSERASDNKHPLSGHTWCLPGPYLRKSMLRAFVREVTDSELPEAFFENSFTESKGAPARSDDEEKVLAMSLGLRMKEEEKAISLVEEDDYDDSEEEYQSGYDEEMEDREKWI